MASADAATRPHEPDDIRPSILGPNMLTKLALLASNSEMDLLLNRLFLHNIPLQSHFIPNNVHVSSVVFFGVCGGMFKSYSRQKNSNDTENILEEKITKCKIWQSA